MSEDIAVGLLPLDEHNIRLLGEYPSERLGKTLSPKTLITLSC